MFARIGRWCHDHRRVVLVAWLLVLLVGGGALGGIGGPKSKAEFELPNVESRRGTDILKADFGGQGAGQSGSIVFEAPQGVDDPAVRRPDTTLARERLGWHPTVSWADGLSDTVAWFRGTLAASA